MEASWEGKISSVRKHSAAETAGIHAGESLCAINGMPLRDILDVSFAAADFEPVLSVRGRDGNVREISVPKEIDEERKTAEHDRQIHGDGLNRNFTVNGIVPQINSQYARKG